MVIDTKEECIDNNGEHDEVLEGLRLHYTETLESEAVNWLDWNNLGVCMYK
jgi:hypothetical protein